MAVTRCTIGSYKCSRRRYGNTVYLRQWLGECRAIYMGSLRGHALLVALLNHTRKFESVMHYRDTLFQMSASLPHGKHVTCLDDRFPRGEHRLNLRVDVTI